MTKEELEKSVMMTISEEDWEMYMDLKREQKHTQESKKQENLEIRTESEELTALRTELFNNRKEQENIGGSEIETYVELLTRESQIEEKIEEIKRLDNPDYEIIEVRCPNCGGIGFGTVAEGFICKSCLYGF